MARNFPRLCPKCGTPAEPNQRFCAECGTVLNAEANKPTALAGEKQFVQPASQMVNNSPVNMPQPPAPAIAAQAKNPLMPTIPMPDSQFYGPGMDAAVIPLPPPPPPETLISAPQTAIPAPQMPSQPGTYSVPAYAQAPKRSRGCLVASIVLLLVLAAGVGAYYFFFLRPGNTQGNSGGHGAQNTPGASNNNSTATAGGNNGTPTNGATNERVNLKFTFSGIDITITSVQYAQSYPDDSSITSGAVRVSLNENNTTAQNPLYVYSDVARLILPGGNAVAPANTLHFESPVAQTSDTNWIDFQVTSQPADLSQLVLQMGTAQENQMQIPLSPVADLSKYQPKTVMPNTRFQYAGLDWTLTSATESLSISGHQATTGNVYIVVALKAFNPAQVGYSGYYGDFARLKAGDTIDAPTGDSNFPTSVASQAVVNGTLVFLMPQGNTSYTLMMLGFSTNPPVKAVSVNFQIQ